jgi:two-component system cell cycle response regulator
VRILVAEPNPAISALITGSIGRLGHEVRPYPDGMSAWGALQQDGAFEFAILSHRLTGATTLDVIRQLRATPRATHVHVLVLTDAETDILTAIRAGADDFLFSDPPDVRELLARVSIASRALRVHATLDSLQDAVRVQSLNDPVTGLYNRRAIVELLGRELARAVREAAPTTVMVADLDGFRELNDAHGNETGDVVLREAARRIRASVRTYDGVGRSGPDELMVVLPRCGLKDGSMLAERLRASIAEAPVHTGLAYHAITASVGFTTIGPGEGLDASEVLRAVEAATAAARMHGNRVEYEIPRAITRS